MVSVWAVSSRSSTGTTDCSPRRHREGAGVAGAVAQLVLEGEVAEQGALQRLHLVELALQERAGLAEERADDVGDPADLADALAQQGEPLAGLLGVGGQLLGDRGAGGLGAADGGHGLLERGEAEQVLELVEQHLAGDGHGGSSRGRVLTDPVHYPPVADDTATPAETLPTGGARRRQVLKPVRLRRRPQHPEPARGAGRQRGPVGRPVEAEQQGGVGVVGDVDEHHEALAALGVGLRRGRGTPTSPERRRRRHSSR